MTKYKYIGNGDFYQHLPMLDVDDKDLDTEQLALLMIAVQRGLYTTVDDLLIDGDVPAAQSLILAAEKVKYGKPQPQDTAQVANETEESNEPPEA